MKNPKLQKRILANHLKNGTYNLEEIRELTFFSNLSTQEFNKILEEIQNKITRPEVLKQVSKKKTGKTTRKRKMGVHLSFWLDKKTSDEIEELINQKEIKNKSKFFREVFKDGIEKQKEKFK